MLNNNSVILSDDEMKLQFNTHKFIMNRQILNPSVQYFTNKIMKNKRLKKFTITLLGVSLYFKDVFAAAKGIDMLGWTLLGLIRRYAYWVLLIWCIGEVIKSGLGGESKKTLSIVMKYVIIFASMYIIPGVFDAIRGSF
ncbi:hypothetical protein KTC96_24615 (plasmid) [Clostridium estertheticum]|uniref:hypothetical protein n=1 Tax=Clostridium estertheticum TaxID=238834 RepID=UPI001C7CEA8F|nr:hypothetical protein [Clostridium estertheticum]MBX4259711.1 hypothetical protein [Clostridium estertheticum]WLC73298.1 hypothetical protein KTC96_24615 [Clostridium estertheticum]